MSLAFLAKKGWHTATLRNQEKVWVAERAHEEEQQRIRDLQKQVEEERQIRELREMQGGQKPEDRINWMYEGPMQTRGDADEKEAEDYLLGKAFKGKQAGVDEIKAADSRYAPSTAEAISVPMSANEISRRLHEDPLLRMRMAEKHAKDKIVANPVKMGKIHSEADRLALEKKEAKKAKKEAKKAKKHAKKEAKRAKKEKMHKRGSRDTSSSSESEEEDKKLSVPLSNNGHSKKRSPSPSPGEKRKRPSSDAHRDDPRYGLIGSKKNANGTTDIAPRADLLAAKAAEDAAREAALQEQRRRRSNGLSREEKLRLAAEMQEDANRHHQLQRDRGSSSKRPSSASDGRSRDRVDAEDEEPRGGKAEGASFLRDMEKKVMADVSMKDRISRSRHYQQKGATVENFLHR